MRRLAALNHDSRQLTVLDGQLERVEYLNKGREAPPVFDFRVWIEYWQDRILYGWGAGRPTSTDLGCAPSRCCSAAMQ